MGRKKKRKDRGVLEYVSVKNRKNVKAFIRELGLIMVSLTRIPDEKGSRSGSLFGAAS